MAKNSIEIKLESTSSKEGRDAPSIKKSEESKPVQAVSASEQEIKNVTKLAESVLTTAEKELKDRAEEARQQLESPTPAAVSPQLDPSPRRELEGSFWEGFGEKDKERLMSMERQSLGDAPEFPVGPEGHQWRMEQDPKTGRFTKRTPLLSFRGHEGETEDPERFGTSNIVQAMTALDRGKEEDPLSSVAIDSDKIESSLSDIDTNTDELEQITTKNLESNAAQAMAALDQGRPRGPKALGSEDVISSIMAGDSGGDVPGGPKAVSGDDEGGDSPTGKLKAMGAAVMPLLGKLGKFGAVVATVTKGAAFLAESFAKLDRFLTRAGEEIQAFAPEIIVEKVNRSIMLLEKRMERADEVGEQLADYEKSRTRLIMAVEDFKTKFIKIVTPFATLVMDALGSVLNAIIKMSKWIRKSLLTIEETILEWKRALHLASADDKKRILEIKAELTAIKKGVTKKSDPAWDHMDKVMTLLTGKGTSVPGFTRVPGSIASGI